MTTEVDQTTVALMGRLVRGDVTAYEPLMTMWWGTSVSLARLFLKSEAEDIAQEVWMRILRRPDEFDPTRGSFSTYLYYATRTQAKKLCRTPSGRAIPIADTPSSLRDGDEDAVLTYIVLCDAVKRLPEVHQRVIAMRSTGATYLEIMDELLATTGRLLEQRELHAIVFRARRVLAKALSAATNPDIGGA